ncbi:amidohydrolase family protein [Salegentibacter salegens]|uniref:Imidazolonepropionase n=1 Tax=Salegentibacter salegens TaxID=143223 RepID=A0A1M7I591_9FLAO|nr:amidohydrolase family protein [Salegentibacter salegens]PRX42844.1 imidazolonepropionase-like amidohydrolase [Salegentibacter salegens]SHM35828.1 Imidazolonepropionase [Salegentibacter salegens]
MNKIICFFLVLIILSSCNNKETKAYDLVIYNAQILDLENEKMSENQSIFISEGEIVEVRKSIDKEQFVADRLIDADGKFVMPGLWDNHVHFRGGDTLIDENKDLLPLFLAYGITTVRDAGGDITPSVMEWKDQIANGELDGPTIFSSGPKLDGDKPAWPGSIEVTSEADIVAALDSLENLEVDYVKTYDGNLPAENYYKIIEEAEKRGLKVTGHMPMSADFMKAVSLGLDGVEHMYYPLKACSPAADSLTELDLGYGMMEPLIDTYDPELADDVFAKMSEENVYVTPTLYIGKTLAEILDVDHQQDSLLNYIGPGIQKTYQGRIEGAKRAKASGSKMREKMEEISTRMIRPMQNAGVSLLAGSDCGAFNSYVYPGESLRGELNALAEAGLSNAEAIKSSIINGPKFMDMSEKYGSIKEGKVADLLLLEKNPMENLQHLKGIIAVIKNGKVINREDIQNMLQEIKQ